MGLNIKNEETHRLAQEPLGNVQFLKVHNNWVCQPFERLTINT